MTARNTDDLYRRLAHHLDQLPGGYPPTESGVEIRILKRLFSPEEAEAALCTSLIPEEAKVIARRAGLSVDQAAERLMDMSLKGLIFRLEPKSSPPLYMAAQFVIGIWEYHVNDLDPELIADVNEYLPLAFDHDIWNKSPQLRTIPVKKSLSAQAEVTAYEQAEELVRSQRKFLVAPCICRREHGIQGKPCDKPEETCLVFGAGVDYYQKNGLGRVISKEEALDILKLADKKGLVLQPSNAKKIVNICCCCGCCCQVLKNIKTAPKPAEIVSTPFIAALDAEKCKACGVCVKRCQMDALSYDDEGVAILDADRCIGCGLCVTTCTTGALTLERKPAAKQKDVPPNIQASYMHLAKARGKLSAGKVASMVLKSKVDRLLAPKR